MPTAYIETFGCQMNERDSEIMAQLLAAEHEPAASLETADVVVVNTCSIREKAEQKAFSLLGRLRRIKERRPGVVVVVAGCVAQQQGGAIQGRMPHVDVVVGPQEIYRLPELVDQARRRQRRVATSLRPDFALPSLLPDLRRGHPHKRFVTIMQGCNNFCTYCVVPYTRGREVSRPAEEVLAEVRHLAGGGVREVTLLGQNVNSYGQDRNGGCTFAGLIRMVAAVPGIRRIRFTTSHPKDLSDELVACFAEVGELCPHIHLPLQSGSDRILARMNRKYTVGRYLELVAALRRAVPEIVITTDIIVGFPGETEEDFQATMRVLEEVRFHGAFSFKYSDRPQAPAARFPEKVPEEVKARRLAALQKRQEGIALARLQEYTGREVEVMVEGQGREPGQVSGRTAGNQIVNFTPCRSGLQPGEFVSVRIEEACLHSLRGREVGPEKEASPHDRPAHPLPVQ